jgi:hypothetical protein
MVRIIRCGSGSVVTWRRAQMVLLSAQGMDVSASLLKCAETGTVSPTATTSSPSSRLSVFQGSQGGPGHGETAHFGKTVTSR